MQSGGKRFVEEVFSLRGKYSLVDLVDALVKSLYQTVQVSSESLIASYVDSKSTPSRLSGICLQIISIRSGES